MSFCTHNDHNQLSNEKKSKKKRKRGPLSESLILEEINDLNGKRKKFKKNHNSFLTFKKSDENFNDISKKVCYAKTENRTFPHKRKSESVLENLVWDCFPNNNINNKQKKIKKHNRSLICEDPHHTFNDISEVKSSPKSERELMKYNKNDTFVFKTMYKNVEHIKNYDTEQNVNDPLFDYKKKTKKKKKISDTKESSPKKNENVNTLVKGKPVNIDNTALMFINNLNTKDTELSENNQSNNNEKTSKKKKKKHNNEEMSPKKNKLLLENNGDKISNTVLLIDDVVNTNVSKLSEINEAYNYQKKAKKKKKKHNNKEMSPKKNILINSIIADSLIPKSIFDEKENIMSKDVEYINSKDTEFDLNNQSNNNEKTSKKKKKKHNNEEMSPKKNKLLLENNGNKISNTVLLIDDVVNTNVSKLSEKNEAYNYEKKAKKKKKKHNNKEMSPKKNILINSIIADSLIPKSIFGEKENIISKDVEYINSKDTEFDLNNQSNNNEKKSKKKKKKHNSEEMSSKKNKLLLEKFGDKISNTYFVIDDNVNTNVSKLSEINEAYNYEKKAKKKKKKHNNKEMSPKKNILINSIIADSLIPKSIFDEKENIISKDVEYINSNDTEFDLNNQSNNNEKKSKKKKKKHNNEEMSPKKIKLINSIIADSLIPKSIFDEKENIISKDVEYINSNDTEFDLNNQSNNNEKKSKKKKKKHNNEEMSPKKNKLINSIIADSLIPRSIFDEKENIMSKDVEYINSKDTEFDLNNQSNNNDKKSKKKKKKHNNEEMSPKKNKLINSIIADSLIPKSIFDEKENIMSKDVEYINSKDTEFDLNNQSNNNEKKSKKKKKKHNNEDTLMKDELINRIIKDSSFLLESINYEKDKTVFNNVQCMNTDDIKLDKNDQSFDLKIKAKEKRSKEESSPMKNKLLLESIYSEKNNAACKNVKHINITNIELDKNNQFYDHESVSLKNQKKSINEESAPKKNGQITEKKDGDDDDDDLFKNIYKHLNSNCEVYKNMLKKRKFHLKPARSLTSSLNELTNDDIDNIRNLLDEELDDEETEVSFNSQKMFEDILESELKTKTHCHVELVQKEFKKKIPKTIDLNCKKATSSEISLLKDFGKKLFDKLFQKYDVPKNYINLDIKLPSDAKKVDIHYIETTISHSVSKERMMVVKKLDPLVKIGAFSKEEDDIIRHNWSKFQQEYNIKNTQQFIANGFEMALAREKRFNFFRYLCQGLPHRLLYSVFTRFNKLFGDTEDRLNFAEEEDKLITKVHRCNAIREKLSFLSVFLKRSTIQLCRRWRTLKLVPFRVERADWTEDLRQKLFTNILLVTKTKNWRDLRKRTIISDEWKKIVKDLRPCVTFQRAMGYWNFMLKNMLFAKRDVYYCSTRLTVLEYLLKLNPKKWTDINWSELTKTLYPDLTRYFVHTLFYAWFVKNVPEELLMNPQKTLKYIIEHLKDKLIRRINRGSDTQLQRLTVKNGILVKVEDEN